MLKIHLFGSGSAHADGCALTGFPGQQAGLLLCYLVLNRSQPIPRERLAAVFWEDLPAITARKYLRNALWRTKQMLAEAGVDPDRLLVITDDFVGLSAERDAWIDIVIFENAFSICRKSLPAALSSIQVQELEDAASVYTGDLLEGIYEDWALYDRERFRLMYLSIRQKLLQHYSAYQRFEEALRQGEQILALDPAREKIHRQMMRLHASNGDRSAALAQYKRCKQVLKDELNLGPMKETRLLYREIRDNLFDPGHPHLDHQLGNVSNVLQRLNKLHRLANRIHAELRTLEKLLNQNMLDTD